jgi:aminopeptidase N
MENITLVTWDDMWLIDEKLATEVGTLVDQITLHEMTHSYFGNALVIRHFEHAWLKESWANYMEAVWIEAHLSRQEFEYNLIGAADGYFGECRTYTRPIVTRVYDHRYHQPPKQNTTKL